MDGSSDRPDLRRASARPDTASRGEAWRRRVTFASATLDRIRERADMRAIFECAGVKLRGGATLTGRCPFHDDRSPSLSVTPSKGLYHCFGCGASGDAIAAYQGLHDVPFPEAVRALADEVGIHLEDTPTVPPTRTGGPRLTRQAAPSPTYPPNEQITALARFCRPVTEDGEVSEYLRYRGIDAAAVAAQRLAFALCVDAPSGVVPHHRPDERGVLPWTATHHRLVAPMFDEKGIRRNVVARSVELLPTRKTAVSGTCAGLVFANQGALRILRGGLASLPHVGDAGGLQWPIQRGSCLAARTVVIAEGEIDFLNVAAERDDFAGVFGVRAGSWNQPIADRLPDGLHIVIATDDDDAGDRYADAIVETLSHRIRSGVICAYRWPLRH